MKKIFLLSAMALATGVMNVQAQDASYSMRVITSSGAVDFQANTVNKVLFVPEAKFVADAIPSGTDLTTFFSADTIFGADKNICYTLAGDYTMSGDIVVPAGYKLSFLTSSSSSIKLTADASFMFSDAFSIGGSNLTIDCSASTAPLIKMSKQPNDELKGLMGSTTDKYDIIDESAIINVSVKGLKNSLISDNGVKYAFGPLTFDNVTVQTELTADQETAFLDLKTWGANDLSISNSTFYSTTEFATKYLVQYNNSARYDRNGYERNSVNLENNTMYKMFAGKQIANYGGIIGRNTTDWVMTNNIFVDCGNGDIAKRFLGQRQNQKTAEFANNTYLRYVDGVATYDDVTNFDNSGTAIEAEPVFKDAANGDFTLDASCKQAELKTGDPDWLPAE